MVEQGECLFCKIASGEIPTKKVYEDTYNIGFLDINPRNPGHTLVIPKKHYEFLSEMSDEDAARLLPAVKKVSAKLRNAMKAHGVSIVQNNGQAAGQIVAHVHFHVIPRFATEGPPSMESILPVKKMDEKTLDQVVEMIKSGGETPPQMEHAPQQAPVQVPQPTKPKEVPIADANKSEDEKMRSLIEDEED